MSLKFTLRGQLRQRFLENKVPLYAEIGLIGHTGVDYYNGFGTPVYTDNPILVYKVARNTDSPSNWQGVYGLAKDENGNYMEICFGHLSRVLVSEGQMVTAGQAVGMEGNFGDVYSGGVKITPAMQRAGDRRGSHVHESWRPVLRTKDSREGHWLRDRAGREYRDYEGFRYSIMLDNPQTRGMIDPMMYLVGGSKEEKKLSMLKTTLSYVYALFAKKK